MGHEPRMFVWASELRWYSSQPRPTQTRSRRRIIVHSKNASLFGLNEGKTTDSAMEQGIDLSDSDLQVEGLSIDDDVGLERDEPTRWLQDSVEPTIPTRDGENIVRQIASFLTLSDAASFASSEMKRMGSESRLGETIGPVESWVSLISAATPETPGLMALSPDDFGFDDSGDWDDAAIRNRMHGRQRTWAKQRLAAAVFANPRSLRSYCLEAHRAASTIRRTRQADPETLREPEQRGLPILNLLVKSVFQNVPLVVAIDIAGAIHETALDVSFATFRISVRTINGVVDAVLSVMRALWDRITRFNPFAVLDAIISLQFNAVGRTSEALVGGIQSVATGVGSASNAALQRLSRGGDAPGGNFRSGPSSASIMNEINMRNDAYNQKVRKTENKCSNIPSRRKGFPHSVVPCQHKTAHTQAQHRKFCGTSHFVS